MKWRFIPVLILVLIVGATDLWYGASAPADSPRLASDEREITIPEGFTVRQIADRLAAAGIVDADALLKLPISNSQLNSKFQIFPAGERSMFTTGPANSNLEGFLFPDTYRFFLNTTPPMVIEKLLARFEGQAWPIIRQSPRPFYDILRVASIVEAEVPHTENRPVVAGILWKRLDARMGLNVDSTLNYVTGNNTRALSARELKINSPYNTYKYRGLPPTPIGNPGLDAIRAAVFPEVSPYWYFLSGMDGVTHFAVTLEEHVKNKKSYLQ